MKCCAIRMATRWYIFYKGDELVYEFAAVLFESQPDNCTQMALAAGCDGRDKIWRVT